MTLTIHLGFVALSDAAPLIVAMERGLFAQECLDVSLHREVSWATVRDKVAAGVLQGAHMLAPLAIAARLGVGSEPVGIVAPMSLNAHGAAIGVSAELAEEMTDTGAGALAKAAAKRQARGDPAITFATVFPYSMHTYMLRYWAASAGLDPDRDLRIVTAPPTSIVDRLKSGRIDGFCVGAPWGTVWPGGPAKVLGLSEDWVDREPETVQALLRALLQSATWADAPENAGALAGMLSASNYLDVPAALILERLGTDRNGLRFLRNAAFFPWRSHAAWIFSRCCAGDRLTGKQTRPRRSNATGRNCSAPRQPKSGFQRRWRTRRSKASTTRHGPCPVCVARFRCHAISFSIRGNSTPTRLRITLPVSQSRG